MSRYVKFFKRSTNFRFIKIENIENAKSKSSSWLYNTDIKKEANQSEIPKSGISDNFFQYIYILDSPKVLVFRNDLQIFKLMTVKGNYWQDVYLTQLSHTQESIFSKPVLPCIYTHQNISPVALAVVLSQRVFPIREYPGVTFTHQKTF